MQEKGRSSGRVKFDGCRASLERDQQLPTTPEVSFEIDVTLACSWLIVAFCALSIDIVGMLHDNSCLVPKIPFARVRGYKIDAFVT